MTVEQVPDQLSAMLERLTELFDEKDTITAELAAVNKSIEQLEPMAVEAMAASGLDGVRAHGKSWFFRDTVSVSIPAEARAAVVEAAANEGLGDFVTVNTSTLKSYLVDRWKELGQPEGSVAAGTAFEGLIREYRERRLGRVTVR
jgi:sigma54-dependent transcription regulator